MRSANPAGSRCVAQSAAVAVRHAYDPTPSAGQRPLLVMIVCASGDACLHLGGCRDAAISLCELGHTPVVGVDALVDFARSAKTDHGGSGEVGATIAGATQRLLLRCDAVLRLGGPSPVADQILRLAGWEGKRAFSRVGDIPPVTYADGATPGLTSR